MRINRRIQRVILALFFILGGGGLVFSFGMDASATHGDDTGIVAEDVDPANEMHVGEFLDKVVHYYEEVYNANFDPANLQALIKEVAIYSRAVRQEGDYRHGETYSLSINERNSVTNHARYPDLFGYRFDPDASGSDVAGTIKKLIDGAEDEMPEKHCETYGQTGRVACARNVSDRLGGHTTFIAGLHHDEEDSAFSEPDCNGFKLATSAEEVHEDPKNDDKLEAYVKEVIRVAQEQFRRAARKAASEAPDPSQIRFLTLKNLYDQSACYRVGDLRHENIYTFIMEAESDPEEPAQVIINGNNFDLNGTNLDLNDDRLSGETNIAKLFNQKLGDVEIGSSTYVNYHWDDPTTDDDNVENFLQNNKVPGTSCKRSYIEVASITALVSTAPPTLYIFGSGTYPGDDVCEVQDDDDGGCAIAGTVNTYKGALFNLFVMASVLFPAVFLRRRM